MRPMEITHLLQIPRPWNVHEHVEERFHDCVTSNPFAEYPMTLVPACTQVDDAQGGNKTKTEDADTDENIFRE